MFKYVKVLECGDYIQFHHVKCIAISINMPSIGFELPEIAVERCLHVNTNDTMLSVNTVYHGCVSYQKY